MSSPAHVRPAPARPPRCLSERTRTTTYGPASGRPFPVRRYAEHALHQQGIEIPTSAAPRMMSAVSIKCLSVQWWKQDAASRPRSAPPRQVRAVLATPTARCQTKPNQTRPLMPSALSKMCFIALAHSSAVVLSSKTSVNVGDDPSSWTTNPGQSGRPSSRQMLCTVLTNQAIFTHSYA
jgi:hypothetical protein